MAMQVTTDLDHKFDLALQLDNLDIALEIVRTLPELESTAKWKALGDRGLAVWRLDLAREGFEKGGDLHSLMLMLLSIGDRKGLKDVAVKAGKIPHVIPRPLTLTPSISTEQKGYNNLAFTILFQLGDTAACVDLLLKTQRAPEAAIFARTYAPRFVPNKSLVTPESFVYYYYHLTQPNRQGSGCMARGPQFQRAFKTCSIHRTSDGES
jgi:coatomer subunit beta'